MSVVLRVLVILNTLDNLFQIFLFSTFVNILLQIQIILKQILNLISILPKPLLNPKLLFLHRLIDHELHIRLLYPIWILLLLQLVSHQLNALLEILYRNFKVFEVKLILFLMVFQKSEQVNSVLLHKNSRLKSLNLIDLRRHMHRGRASKRTCVSDRRDRGAAEGTLAELAAVVSVGTSASWAVGSLLGPEVVSSESEHFGCDGRVDQVSLGVGLDSPQFFGPFVLGKRLAASTLSIHFNY